ncbi:putative quinol monooxygenase [Paenibacillus aurantius]|uniref:Quinol monooxygenase n=1 Tax=Paenibacillus aurantius TaxID=2918900 RepID=A0AA96LDM8_9BACL|nr:putative quinol monooxygenase [Paenibacillus aurantius]WNQ11415.1 putative quinol monooxygenase [Paenibacillus aurantius]
MIIIHAQLTIDPAKREMFLQAVQPLIAASRAESGNVSYDLYQPADNANVYTMVEVWQDAQAVADHNASESFTSFVGQAKNFLTAPLGVKAYEGQPLPQ